VLSALARGKIFTYNAYRSSHFRRTTQGSLAEGIWTWKSQAFWDLAALNYAKHLLAEAHFTSRPDADIIAPETVEVSNVLPPRFPDPHTPQEITSICTLWLGDFYLEVEDIYGITFFNRPLDLVDMKFERPSSDQITQLLSVSQDLSMSQALRVYPDLNLYP
jgi:hypothetical protein